MAQGRRVRAPRLEWGASVAYLRKWVLVGALIGIGVGLAALILIAGIRLASGLFLGNLVGHTPPSPGSEGGAAGFVFVMERRWALPLVLGLAGLLGGLLVGRVAPEAEGIGTDAAIAAFHESRPISIRVVAAKIVASSITIGGGLTSGREGPIAQAGGGLGSVVGRVLNLTPRERNIALAAGVGAGIAAMFKAPLAGALIAAEVFYREDFEVEALVPGIIASVVGYGVTGSVLGFQPIFSAVITTTAFPNPFSLVLYAALGLACALLARLMVQSMKATRAVFRGRRIWVATSLGGLLTGLVALAVPSIIGTGYGWVQIALDQDYALLPPAMVLAAAFAEIAAVSLTLGSGNSGGVFGPSIVTGGMFGAFFGWAVMAAFPSLAISPANFAIVGMVAMFAGAAKAPVSTIIMVAEMTGGYALLAPAMFAVVTAHLFSGRESIFPAQRRTRVESPFHLKDFEPSLLLRGHVRDAMVMDVVTVPPDLTVADALTLLAKKQVGGLPVVDGGRLVGLVTLRDVVNVKEGFRAHVPVSSVMSRSLRVAHPEEDLYAVLKRMLREGVGRLPVVPREDPRRLVGIITRSDIGAALGRVAPSPGDEGSP